MLAIVAYKIQNIPDFSKSLWAKAPEKRRLLKPLAKANGNGLKQKAD
jgi:hypothetical protein